MSAQRLLPRTYCEQRCTDLLRELLGGCSFQELKKLYMKLKGVTVLKIPAERLLGETVRAAAAAVLPKRYRTFDADGIEQNLAKLLQGKKLPIAALRSVCRSHGWDEASIREKAQARLARQLSAQFVKIWCEEQCVAVESRSTPSAQSSSTTVAATSAATPPSSSEIPPRFASPDPPSAL